MNSLGVLIIVSLLLRGAKCFLGQAVSRKSSITPSILTAAFDLFNFSIPLHATMWALFLVAFFTFLCKSNLVPDNPRQISPKVITCIGQIWSSPPQALIFMSQLLKPFSASSALLFCLFPRSLGLVFAPSLRYVVIYCISQSWSKLGSRFYCFIGIDLRAHYLPALFWVSFTGSVSTSLRPFFFFPAQFSKGWGYFCV